MKLHSKRTAGASQTAGGEGDRKSLSSTDIGSDVFTVNGLRDSTQIFELEPTYELADPDAMFYGHGPNSVTY